MNGQDQVGSDIEHSRAFANLVRSGNDVVGLLAYAKYKQSVHEAAVAGTVTSREARNISPAMVEVLRSAAEQILTQVVDDGIQAAAPDIEKSALMTAFEARIRETITVVREERATINEHTTSRTSFVPAFFTNLAAWAVTLLVAFLIVYLFSRPSPDQVLQGVVDEKQAIESRSRK